MYETDGDPIFTATDRDGDKLVIENYGPGQWAFTVAGEDGHRTVLLNEDDIERLTGVLTVRPFPEDFAQIAHRG
jgi:hypothetical protein